MLAANISVLALPVGLLLGTEAPVMTPNDMDFSFHFPLYDVLHTRQPRLLLCTEAPLMMPSGVDFSFSSTSPAEGWIAIG